MAEKKYIDSEAAIETIKSLYPSVPLFKLNIDKWHEKNKAYMECEIAIEALPAADVREVVYCRECKHRPVKECGRIIAPKDADGYTDYKCPFLCDDPWYNRMPADDDYCSCGERRQES